MSRQSNSQLKKRAGLIHQPFPDHEINLFNPPKKNPNGYLTSARLYLDGFLEEQPPPADRAHKNWQKNLLNPWTISAIVIILLANLVAGLAILRHHKEAEKAIQVNSTELSIGPNLAAKEFIDLNVSSLSTISSPSSVEKEQDKLEVENSIIENYPDYIPTYAAHPLMSKSNNYYYILAEYAGDRSLELAKAKVHHVSLVNFPQGIFIYLGAFEQKNRATEFVADLRKEGLYAYIYPFD